MMSNIWLERHYINSILSFKRIFWPLDVIRITSRLFVFFGQARQGLDGVGLFKSPDAGSKTKTKIADDLFELYPDTNLGTRFAEAAKAANIGEIPRPYDNMRASRSTEIDRKYGPKVESMWIGHGIQTLLDGYRGGFR